MQARGTRTVSFYGLTWAMPMVLWQLVFFVFPLCFLVALTFWLVRNYRMVPGFDHRQLGQDVLARILLGTPSASPSRWRCSRPR